MALPTRLVCSGCGYRAPAAELPLRCPRAEADPDTDHVLRRRIEGRRLSFPKTGEANPFVRYRTLWHGYQRALANGRSDADVVAAIEALDVAVARVDGHGFGVTPFGRQDALSAQLAFDAAGGVWVKNETSNVSGSHKARHLFGAMLELILGEVDRAQPLAIASCGNAALAAAVVARAADWPLRVFVPVDADPAVLARLEKLDAEVTPCERRPEEVGDPSYLRLREAIADGAIPFTCQGNECGLAIEGGLTLGYELAEEMRARAVEPDHLFVQVGGGALASSVIQGLGEAKALGVIDRLPRIHAVQTLDSHPLERAYELVRARLRERLGGQVGGAVARLRVATTSGSIDGEFGWIARHRSAFMWPWTPAAHSVATGILDDETYDWFAVVHGMLATGGQPVVVEEDTLVEANRVARATTGIEVDTTGSAGLAGLMELRRQGEVHDDETCAVLFTGVRRNGGTS